MKDLKEINSENIEQMINKNDNLLIIFSNPECGYCGLAKKSLEEIIDKFSDLTVGECIVNNNPELKEKYSITSVPMFKLIKNGEVVYTDYGVVTANNLYYQLYSLLN
ncbi:thioredoxin family protein [Halanaerobacter jeridensis]|uniref:Thioredoxin 1 n=1 Tax=Halanaerobacter jeridensis TaxID=706427 RepID=A0A939BM37_9FIRM|nr:thioredoxin family protein [Halanaerobacter jeridensis]MBM7555560.1 thioredoxin 1 [Halanaerobacter jeridensis]